MMKIIGTLLFITIFTSLLLLLSKTAQPTSGLYTFRRIYEKGILLTKKTPEMKASYTSELLDYRLAELELVYKEKGSTDKISTNLRYSSMAGQLATLIKNYHLSTMKSQTLKQFSEHTERLKKLSGTYPGIEKSYLEDDINYLKTYSSELMIIK